MLKLFTLQKHFDGAGSVPLTKLWLFDLLIKKNRDTSGWYLFKDAPALPSVPVPSTFVEAQSVNAYIGTPSVTSAGSDVTFPEGTTGVQIRVTRPGCSNAGSRTPHGR